MKINEFFNNPDNNEPTINYDPGKDLVIFMQSDPMFYRKHLYPAMIDFERAGKAGKIANKKSLLPIVDHAIKQYCAKYELPQDPKKLFPDEIKTQIIDELLNPDPEPPLKP